MLKKTLTPYATKVLMDSPVFWTQKWTGCGDMAWLKYAKGLDDQVGFGIDWCMKNVQKVG